MDSGVERPGNSKHSQKFVRIKLMIKYHIFSSSFLRQPFISMSPPAAKISKKTDIVAELSAARARVASDVTEYKFSRQELDRFKLVGGSEDELEERCKSGVLYWMRRYCQNVI